MLKITVLCDVAPCSLVEVSGRFRDAYCLRHLGPNDREVSTCEASVNLH